MKKLLPFILFQLLATICLAQSQSDSNYSFGVKLLSIDEQPKLLNEIRGGSSNFYTSGLNGLVLKVNDNQISYRFSGFVFKKDDYSFTNQCSNCEFIKGNYTSLDLRIGFEKSLTYSKLQPFYGADLGFKQVSFDGASASKITQAYMYSVDIEKNGGVFNPFIGIKYNVIRALTLSAEAGFDFIYTYDKETKTDANNTLISLSNYKRWQYSAKPLASLSLQFNFGRNQ